MAKTKKPMFFQRVKQKVDELERALGKKLTSAEVVVAQPSAQPVRAMPGWSYVVKEERPDKSFSLFTSILSQGSKGICISRTHPDVLKQKYGFDAESIWLTKTETAQPPAVLKSIEYVSPNNLARLASSVRDFLAKGPNGAVIIEGLEDLTNQNDFRSVLTLFQLIHEQGVVDKGYLLVPVDCATIAPEEFFLIE